MFSYVICRVVGNELPPKDRPGDKLKSLQFVLNQDQPINASRLWLLNRIIDTSYLAKVKSILKDEQIIESPFNRSNFFQAKDKIHYLTNINPARNQLIEAGAKIADFVVSLDQDCFFTKELWDKCTKFIETNKGQLKHYGLVSKRITSLNNIWHEPDNEPMLIFRKDAQLKFDENLPFAQNDKSSLLRNLGYKKRWICTGQRCKTCGYVLHIGYDEQVEKDVKKRVDLRLQGLQNLLEKAKPRSRRIL